MDNNSPAPALSLEEQFDLGFYTQEEYDRLTNAQPAPRPAALPAVDYAMFGEEE